MKLNHEKKIGERVNELCKKIEERSSDMREPIDFSEHLRWFLSDTWSHLVYGLPTGCVARGEDIGGLLQALQGVYGMSATAAVNPWLMPLLRAPMLRKYLWKYTKTFRNMDKLYSNFEKMLDLGKTKGDTKCQRLFFDGLFEQPNGFHGPRYTREDLKAEVITFTAATLDGAAAAISPFIDNMIQNPHILQRLVAEIELADKNKMLSTPVVTYEETTQLP